jgi:hypothetical protein
MRYRVHYEHPTGDGVVTVGNASTSNAAISAALQHLLATRGGGWCTAITWAEVEEAQ